MQLNADDRWLQWNGWYEAAYKDTLTLLHNRHIWRNLLAMLQANPEIEHHTAINDWLSRCYSQTQAVGIRRQSQMDERRPTMGALLRELATHPSIPTRARYTEDLSDPANEELRSGWNQFADPDTDQFDAAEATGDLDRLVAVAEPVRQWVNRAVAHRSKDTTTNTLPGLTYGHINEALDELARITRK